MNIFVFQEQKPKEYFARFWMPALFQVAAVSFILQFYRAGAESGASFDFKSGIIGVVLFEIVTILCCALMKRGRVGAYTRFIILFQAFVPHLSITYLSRLLDPEFLLSIRDDAIGQKMLAGIAIWMTDIKSFMPVLIPVLLLMLSALSFAKMPKWYRNVFIICGVLLCIMYFMSGLQNLLEFIFTLLIVCVIDDCWERIRTVDTLEPQILVSWAEILLFIAFWLKSIVELMNF